MKGLFDDSLNVLRAEMRAGFECTNRRLEQLQATAQQTDNLLRGSDSETGLKVRLDRLEQAEGRRRWTIRAVAIAAFGALCQGLVSLVSALRSSTSP